MVDVHKEIIERPLLDTIKDKVGLKSDKEAFDFMGKMASKNS